MTVAPGSRWPIKILMANAISKIHKTFTKTKDRIEAINELDLRLSLPLLSSNGLHFLTLKAKPESW